MTQRYYLESPVQGASVVLTGSEAHHLARVMRIAVGDEVTLFDGSGVEFAARVERVGSRQIALAVLGRTEIDRELPFHLTLAAALPKGDRQKWLIEKLVELGVTRLVPLVTRRGVAKPVDKAVDRLERSVIEASKQCGRNRLMEISDGIEWSRYLEQPPATALRIVAHPGGSFPRVTPSCQDVFLAIGPEGGFAEDEIAAALASGWQARGLGPRILRVETAATLLVAQACLEHQGAGAVLK